MHRIDYTPIWMRKVPGSNAMTQPIKFYTMSLSGHAHRVELLLRALGLEYQAIEVDLIAREHKSEAFLAINPLGQVPAIDDKGKVIWDSTAILTYLCLTYDVKETFLPRDPALFAEVIIWLGKASGPVAFGLATARRINLFKAPLDISAAHQISHDFLSAMNARLTEREWLVGEVLSIADMACYAYVAHAPEGGVDLRPFEHITDWIARFETQSFFKPLPKSPVGLWSKIDP
jgi:glutathione S-transferase